MKLASWLADKPERGSKSYPLSCLEIKVMHPSVYPLHPADQRTLEHNDCVGDFAGMPAGRRTAMTKPQFATGPQK